MANQPDRALSDIDQTRLASSTSAPAVADGLEGKTLLSGSGFDALADERDTKNIPNLPVTEVTLSAGAPSTRSVGGETSPPRQRPVEGFAVGQRFQGKYEILRLLGVGGMGRVYQARHCELETMVAIKVMSAALSSDGEAVERFKREAKAMARVQHPNAVRIIDYGVEQGECYLIMEFLQGETLRERLARQGRLPVETLVRYAEQAFAVLEFMHRQNITHRDLKPDNIFLARSETTGEEIVKVLDFGIAKIQTSTVVNMTTEGTMMGTPRYMAPEQCRGVQIDGRADLYSMGVVLYEMCAGAPPFDGDNPITVALKQVNEPPPPLRERNPEISEAIAAVIHKALEKSPSHRFRSARDFSQALLEAANLAPRDFPDGRQLAPPAAADQSELANTLKRPAVDAGGATRPYGSRLPLDEAAPKRPNWLLYAVAGIALLSLLIGGAQLAGWRAFQPAPSVATPEPPRPVVPKSLESFAFIPAGTFSMGREPGSDEFAKDKRAPLDETPSHTVSVGAFYLAKYETTNAEYKRFIEATGHPAPRSWKQGSYPPGQDDFPVTGVSWNDARAYCEWLTRANAEGVTFRLPTEAEWEYAARGADGRLFPWGNFWRDGTANILETFSASQVLLLPVNVEPNNTRDKSAFGIFGMGGNVCEWTASDFTVYPGSGYRPAGRDLECKVYRGGHFASPLSNARTTSRKWTLTDTTQDFLGFRLAATPPQP